MFGTAPNHCAYYQELQQHHFDVISAPLAWVPHLIEQMNYRPIMELDFSDKHTHFLIRLPERMRPGNYWQYTHIFLQVALPLIPLLISLRSLKPRILYSGRTGFGYTKASFKVSSVLEPPALKANKPLIVAI